MSICPSYYLAGILPLKAGIPFVSGQGPPPCILSCDTKKAKYFLSALLPLSVCSLLPSIMRYCAYYFFFFLISAIEYPFWTMVGNFFSFRMETVFWQIAGLCL